MSNITIANQKMIETESKIKQLIAAMDNFIIFIPERVKLTELKKLPQTKCWRYGSTSDKFILFVNIRTGQRLVELPDLGIFDLGVSY